MVRKHHSPLDRTLPGINFNLLFPINFPISSTKDLEVSLKVELANQNKDVSTFYRDEVFRGLGITSIRELSSKSPKIRNAIATIRDEVRDLLGIPPRGFSDWGRSKAEDFLKSVGGGVNDGKSS